MDKRFIEELFPVMEISKESSNTIRRGNISNIHLWWARRPVQASRATNYSALIPIPKDEMNWEEKKRFIIDFSKWENSLDENMIQRARKEILDHYGGKTPKVLDPFGGGGSIPLEALRLGCDTYSNDYNPVAVLIQKCTLEYPQRFGRGDSKDWGSLSGQSADNPLLNDVTKWAKWILEETKNEIENYYPYDSDGSIPVGYIWSKTIPCQNPTCGAIIPLMKQYWLRRKNLSKDDVNWADSCYLKPVIDNKNKMVTFDIIRNKESIGFNPSEGTITGSNATCLLCGSVVDGKTTKSLFQSNRNSEQLIAEVLHTPGKSGKVYRKPRMDCEKFLEGIDEVIRKKNESFLQKWGINSIPDEPTPFGKGRGAERAFSLRNYGINTWGELFNPRQLLSLITFVEKIRISYQKMIEEGYDPDYARAITCYEAFILDRLASFSTNNCRWKSGSEQNIPFVSGRSAIPIVFDYFEINPIGELSTSWSNSIGTVMESIPHLSELPKSCTITQSTATKLPYHDSHFDAVFTDPPYYDNVPYSYLSDFFYVWLSRSVGYLFPELFSTPLTPKNNEIVVYSYGEGGFDEGKAFFEDMLKKSFQEIHRVLKPNGIALIVYAHKSTEGWETLVNSLLDSGLIMTGAWPLNTEMPDRIRAKESAALASSIYIVARKMNRQPNGFYNDVKDQLKKHLNKKLERLWQEGIGGADFFIAAIGSAIEVFGKYEQVIDYEGNVIRADRLLMDVRKIATDYAVKQILHNGFAGEISDLTRFYVLWRWNYGSAKVQFDEARKLAQSVGIDIAHEWGRKGFITKEKEFIQVRGPEDRNREDMKNSSDLIDILHQVLLLWAESKRNKMVEILQISGYGNSEAFFRVAQAISETLPIENKEKKLLDGFLAGRERLQEQLREGPVQRTLY